MDKIAFSETLVIEVSTKHVPIGNGDFAWETVFFRGDGKSFDAGSYTLRYENSEDAGESHKRIVSLLRALSLMMQSLPSKAEKTILTQIITRAFAPSES